VGYVRINGAHTAAVLMFGAAALTPVTVWLVRACLGRRALANRCAFEARDLLQ
jgi:hypothetical protein